MSAPAPVAAVVRTYFRALLTGDRELLATVSLPHPELGSLVPARSPTAAVAPMLAELGHLQMTHEPLPAERHLVKAFLGGVVHLLVLRDAPLGPRVDLRHAIEANRPDDHRRAAARAFYRALLLGDLPQLRGLAFDDRGIELLANHEVPAGEHAQLLHQAEMLGLVELAVGEPFAVPNGVQFVSDRHAEMGITVFSGLTPDGEIPFLVRQRDGAWKVIPFHFLQSAALSRGATISS